MSLHFLNFLPAHCSEARLTLFENAAENYGLIKSSTWKFNFLSESDVSLYYTKVILTSLGNYELGDLPMFSFLTLLSISFPILNPVAWPGQNNRWVLYEGSRGETSWKFWEHALYFGLLGMVLPIPCLPVLNWNFWPLVTVFLWTGNWRINSFVRNFKALKIL